jgi:predicted DNA-binding protein
MQVRFKPGIESRLNELVAKTSRSAADLIEDAMVGYLAEVAETCNMLDGRYDDVKSGRVSQFTANRPFDSFGARAKSPAPAVHDGLCPSPRSLPRH